MFENARDLAIVVEYYFPIAGYCVLSERENLDGTFTVMDCQEWFEKEGFKASPEIWHKVWQEIEGGIIELANSSGLFYAVEEPVQDMSVQTEMTF